MSRLLVQIPFRLASAVWDSSRYGPVSFASRRYTEHSFEASRGLPSRLACGSKEEMVGWLPELIELFRR
jgi:hypothetical protein